MDIKEAREIVKHHTWDDEIQAIIEKRGRKDSYHELSLEAHSFISGYEAGVREAAKIARIADHCDLPGHGCTQEIERDILKLLGEGKV